VGLPSCPVGLLWLTHSREWGQLGPNKEEEGMYLWKRMKKKRRVHNTKAKGSKNELRAKAIIESYGWVVTKSAASLGAFDLWAMHPHHPTLRLLQVKTNKLPRPQEREDMINSPVAAYCQLEIWVFVDGKPSFPRVLFWRGGVWEEMGPESYGLPLRAEDLVWKPVVGDDPQEEQI
jgi:hypothetical protein